MMAMHRWAAWLCSLSLEPFQVAHRWAAAVLCQAALPHDAVHRQAAESFRACQTGAGYPRVSQHSMAQAK